MARAARRSPSSIDKLPPEIRELIGRLRENGATIDQIKAKLDELDADVSRSALGRHIKGLAEVGERLRHSREVAAALVSRFGEEPDNRVARLNIELMHGLVMQAITATTEGEDGEPGAVTFTPEDTMFLARSLQSLATAQKTDTDRLLKVRVEVAKEAAKAVETVGKAKGLTKETMDAIKHAVLGIA
ncbi:MAG: DUF3486 family protein [Candidatus Brevundimonas colombiensis]|uniref:DUF3486 family protein n=1 Tax=Candidatus Brevundimonas colombiensis TaxID=3121376 RepID=A0AAJ5WYL3_9CAUL|nr:DUF3486 family protein [Brevundimonas sp.]WEK38669.1 MAG: DUF3486 family protein [Brevundimonas sp.]